MTTPGPDGMVAGWIETALGPLFAAYHPGAKDRPRTTAVLLCDPFGSDRMNLHATYRELALRLSAMGFHVLRIDYPGTCDSLGGPRRSSRVSTWLDALDAGASWIKTTSGCPELSVFGAMLGGTLAAALASRRNDVTGMVLWGPYPTGRAFVREAVAFAQMSVANPDRVRPDDWEEGDVDAMGLLLPTEMVDELKKLSLTEMSFPGLRAASIHKRNTDTPVDALFRHLETAGISVDAPVKSVDVSSVGEDPLPPDWWFDAVLKWWDRNYPSLEVGTPPLVPNLSECVAIASDAGAVVQEQMVRFGSDRGLFGILTEGDRSLPRPSFGIVFVSGGWNHRVGINRNQTTWGRQWALLGFDVLRFDIRGFGDSLALRPGDRGLLYRRETVMDLVDAMDYMQARTGLSRFVFIGLCAGGYQALHCAIADPRVVGLALLNPLRLSPGGADGVAARVVQPVRLSRFVQSIGDPGSWKRLLSFDSALPGRLTTLGNRFAAAGKRWLRRKLDPSALPPVTWLGRTIALLVERGTQILVVFDAGDVVCHGLLAELDGVRPKLDSSGRFSDVAVANTNHIFSPLRSQMDVERILRDAIIRWRQLA
ncbi:MAG: alpha/beta fold hydrolase [Deltaproteobacteria bacterium]|nr:alpha/beta fold hydrolase [Deltaproteobacteria bacterium]